MRSARAAGLFPKDRRALRFSILTLALKVTAAEPHGYNDGMVLAVSRPPWYSFQWKTIGRIFFWTLLPWSLVVLGILRLGQRLRLSPGTLLAGAILEGLFVVYVGSYYVLSRRGMQEAPSVGLDGYFLYVPFSQAQASHDLTRHRRLAAVYAPLNALDQAWFQGDRPAGHIMWTLGP